VCHLKNLKQLVVGVGSNILLRIDERDEVVVVEVFLSVKLKL
jgi:UDP-N-acetylenolpyruvoylglucosamine reductase